MKRKTKTRTIRYLGPGHRLVLTTGEVVPRDGVAEVSEQEAEHMARSKSTWIEYVDEYETAGVEALVEAYEEPEAEGGAGQTEEKEQ